MKHLNNKREGRFFVEQTHVVIFHAEKYLSAYMCVRENTHIAVFRNAGECRWMQEGNSPAKADSAKLFLHRWGEHQYGEYFGKRYSEGKRSRCLGRAAFILWKKDSFSSKRHSCGRATAELSYGEKTNARNRFQIILLSLQK